MLLLDCFCNSLCLLICMTGASSYNVVQYNIHIHVTIILVMPPKNIRGFCPDSYSEDAQ